MFVYQQDYQKKVCHDRNPSKGLYSNSSTKKQTFKKVFITFGAKFK
jgi:hypothetical protein